jgi:hypothetical protein
MGAMFPAASGAQQTGAGGQFAALSALRQAAGPAQQQMAAAGLLNHPMGPLGGGQLPGQVGQQPMGASLLISQGGCG